MMQSVSRLFLVVCAIGAAACSSKNPGQPTASVTAPQAQTPANNSQVAYGSQPVTLTIQNAVVTSSSGTTYTFEVATDTGFAAKVMTRDAVPEGSGARTSVVADTLAGSRDYYWHARASGGGTVGPFGPTFKFTVGPPITIAAPVPIGPLTGSQSNPRPALRVSNATRQGPAGAITYRFEIASDTGFGSIVASSTRGEGVNETGFIPDRDLPVGGTLFWRAFALDAANGVTSAPSATQSFKVNQYSQAEQVAAQLGVPLWPAAVPPGTVGHATMGFNWNIQIMHHVPTNTTFQSPTPEDLRIFDLLDRGFDPVGATSWLNANGYPTVALWYPPPEKAVIGLPYTYIGARDKIVVNGIWDITLKLE